MGRGVDWAVLLSCARGSRRAENHARSVHCGQTGHRRASRRRSSSCVVVLQTIHVRCGSLSHMGPGWWSSSASALGTSSPLLIMHATDPPTRQKCGRDRNGRDRDATADSERAPSTQLAGHVALDVAARPARRCPSAVLQARPCTEIDG